MQGEAGAGMKIAARQADSFCRAPSGETRAVLVYGPDNGLVRERADLLVASAVDDPSDPFRVAELVGDAIAGDGALLVDEAVLEQRRADLQDFEPRYTSGFLAKYAALALGADKGAVTQA